MQNLHESLGKEPCEPVVSVDSLCGTAGQLHLACAICDGSLNPPTDLLNFHATSGRWVRHLAHLQASRLAWMQVRNAIHISPNLTISGSPIVQCDQTLDVDCGAVVETRASYSGGDNVA